jgi:transposase-like protein
VELVHTTGKPIAQVAEELGIYDSTLGNWAKQDRIDRGERDGLTSDERARLRELEAENARRPLDNRQERPAKVRSGLRETRCGSPRYPRMCDVRRPCGNREDPTPQAGAGRYCALRHRLSSDCGCVVAPSLLSSGSLTLRLHPLPRWRTSHD